MSEIKVTQVGEDEGTGWKRYIEFEYDGLTYTGWLNYDIYSGYEFNGIYGDFEELFNKMGGYIDTQHLEYLSNELQRSVLGYR